tara:strand:- start:82 stop:582 length:501 start_codon:yes stop_codon:yes gene_type:complete
MSASLPTQPTATFFLLVLLMSSGWGCTLPCEEGEQDFKVFQNGEEIQDGAQLVLGDVMVGGPQGGSHAAVGTSFNTHISGVTRSQFASLSARLVQDGEEIGAYFSGSQLDPETCNPDDAIWELSPSIAIYNVESLLDLDGQPVTLEITLEANEEQKREYSLTLFVE